MSIDTTIDRNQTSVGATQMYHLQINTFQFRGVDVVIESVLNPNADEIIITCCKFMCSLGFSNMNAAKLAYRKLKPHPGCCFKWHEFVDTCDAGTVYFIIPNKWNPVSAMLSEKGASIIAAQAKLPFPGSYLRDWLVHTIFPMLRRKEPLKAAQIGVILGGRRRSSGDSGCDGSSEAPLEIKRRRKNENEVLDCDTMTLCEEKLADQKRIFDTEIASIKSQLENAQSKTKLMYESLTNKIRDISRERDNLRCDLANALKTINELNANRDKIRTDVCGIFKKYKICDVAEGRFLYSILDKAINPNGVRECVDNYLVLYSYTCPLQRVCVKVVRGSLAEIEACENDISISKSNTPETYTWMLSATEFCRQKLWAPYDLWERVKAKYPHFFYATTTSNNNVVFLNENELRTKFENDLKNSHNNTSSYGMTGQHFLKLNLANSNEAVERCLTTPENVKRLLVDMVESVSISVQNELLGIINPS